MSLGFSEATPAIKTPTREQLLKKLRSANSLAKVWVFVQLIALFVVSAIVDWTFVVREPILATVAIGMVVGPALLPILYLWAQQKMEIGDLKESTRFGEFDKHSLRALYRKTVQKLGLPDKNLPVFITADKSLNAGAVRLGLLGWVRSLNGVYLNRQVLHRLDEEEIQDIVGHELGHYYRYYLISDRFRMLTVVLGGVVGLLMAQWLGSSNMLIFLGSMIVGAAFFKVGGLLWGMSGETIEYLCDDLGAQVGGVHVSINGLLKLGVDAETQQEIFQGVTQAQLAGNLNPIQVFEAVEREKPYGNPSKEELQAAIDRAIRLQTKKEDSKSLAGFLDHMWNSDSEEDINEQLEERLQLIRKVKAVPRLNWESCLSDPNYIRFQEYEIERLIEMIESRPREVLFQLPEELGIAPDIHPPIRKRILYLWRNRNEIEQAARSGGERFRLGY